MGLKGATVANGMYQFFCPIVHSVEIVLFSLLLEIRTAACICKNEERCCILRKQIERVQHDSKMLDGDQLVWTHLEGGKNERGYDMLWQVLAVSPWFPFFVRFEMVNARWQKLSVLAAGSGVLAHLRQEIFCNEKLRNNDIFERPCWHGTQESHWHQP